MREGEYIKHSIYKKLVKFLKFRTISHKGPEKLTAFDKITNTKWAAEEEDPVVPYTIITRISHQSTRLYVMPSKEIL